MAVIVVMFAGISAVADYSSSATISTQMENVSSFSTADKLDDIYNMAQDDEITLTNIVKLFSHAKIYQVENYMENVDFTPFFDFDSASKTNLQYMCDKMELEKEMHKLNRADVLWSNLEVEIKDISIERDTASVTAYESYSYVRQSTPDIDSWKGIEYYYTFNRINGSWLISDIKTNSTFDNAMLDEGLDVASYVAAAEIEVESDSILEYAMPEMDLFAATAWKKTSIDADSVATYANKYAKNYNSNFFSYKVIGNNGDCQNFASQCIWYGLGGVNTKTAIDNMQWPMIPDQDDDRGWFQLSVWSRDEYNHWASVTSFADYVKDGGTRTWGLTGTVTNGIANASYGDIIQVADSNGYYHSFVVVAHSGTAGSRTAANLWVSGHTTDMYNVQFSDVYSAANTYRTIHVTGSWRDA